MNIRKEGYKYRIMRIWFAPEIPGGPTNDGEKSDERHMTSASREWNDLTRKEYTENRNDLNM